MSISSSMSEGPALPTGADIIDLDRYMRSSVRPSLPRSGRTEHLVVDAGALGRRQVSPSTCSGRGSSSEGPRISPIQYAPINTGQYPPPHKRYSHDSGVSDGSFVRRKQRNRRVNEGNRVRESSRHSGSSIREFRAVCERTLKEQQQQIARVAQICERLATADPERKRHTADIRDERVKHSTVREDRARQPPSQHATSEPAATGIAKPPGQDKVPGSGGSSDSSELSSSSRTTSSRRRKRKDKHLNESCKTYKIIMRKLEELSRVFAARRPPPQPSSMVRALSSGTVSLRDKLVATEPHENATTVQTMLCSGSAVAARTREKRLEFSQANKLDIAPARPNNVLVHSIVESDSSGCSVRKLNQCGFDLDDPVHLYAQAKRLNPHMTRPGCYTVTEENATRERGRVGGRVSLCSLCRSYWRSLWRCLPSYVAKDC
ncbi:unnamed protein product [Leptosia nina]|uniref:Uncharacterized protein n=1 Tax=Leptosia nina TaxID=320188 RepID=A0AAV1JKQ1_9NEOP